MQPDPAPHAPRGKASPLFLLAVVSILLGGLFLVWRLVVDTATPDLLTEAEQRRNLLLLVIGIVLSAMGVLTLLFHVASDPNLSTGTEGRLKERLEQGNLLTRVALLPVLLVSQKRGRLVLNIGLMVLLATWLLVLTNYVFDRHDLWRLDLTSSELYTLSEESKALVRDLDTGERWIRVVGLMRPGSQETQQVQSLLEQYSAITKRVKAEYLDPNALTREKLKTKLEELDILGAAMTDAGGVVVQSGYETPDGWKRERSKWIPIREFWSQDLSQGPQSPKRTFVGERKISSAILEVLEEKRPKLYFLMGHQEASIGDFKEHGLAQLVQRLRERNYEVATLNLLEVKQPGVPADCSLLIVAGPKTDLTPQEVTEVKAYLQRGGDAMFLLDPVLRPRRDRTAEWQGSALADMLGDTYGVRVGDRLVARIAPARGGGMRRFFGFAVTDLDRNQPITKPLADQGARVAFNWVRPVIKVPTLNVNTTPLVKTNRNWGRRYCRAYGQPYTRDRQNLDMEPGPFTLAVAVNNEEPAADGKPAKRTRFVVVGDVDWATNALILDRSSANLELFLNSLNWCIERETRAVGQVRRPADYRLNMSEQELKSFKLASLLGFPLFAVALGIFAWVVRYRS